MKLITYNRPMKKNNKAFYNVSPNHPTLILCHQQISYLSFKAFLERVQRLAVHLEFRVGDMYHTAMGESK